MTAKQIAGSVYAPDGSLYITPTDGNGNLISISGSGTTPGGSTTQLQYNSSGSFAGTSGITTNGVAKITMTGTPSIFTFDMNNIGGASQTLNGGLSGPLVATVSPLDYSTLTSGSTRPYFFGTTLSPTVDTSNIWTQLSSIVVFAGPGKANAEINTFYSDFVMNSGQTSTSTVENYEAKVENSGTLNAYSHYIGLSLNNAGGTITTLYGSKYNLINSNSTAGAVATYAAIDMEPLSGGGSTPTAYYFLRGADSLAGSAFLGNVAIGSLAVPSNVLFDIKGADTSGSTTSVKITDSASANILVITNDGLVRVAKSSLVLGQAGSVVGKAIFQNATSGNLTIQAATGALSGTLTLPNVTDTLAVIGTTQTFSAKQSFSTQLNYHTYIVSTLPGSPAAGDVALVSDATSNVLIGAGGGTAYCLVAYTGAAWVAV